MLKNNNLFDEKIKTIFETVQNLKDEGVQKLTEQFDYVKLSSNILYLKDLEDLSFSLKGSNLENSIQNIKNRIISFQSQTNLQSFSYINPEGFKISQKIFPLENVGLYIPGGKAPLISTVLMLVIPAKLAGVKNITLCTPPKKNGLIDEKLALVLKMCEIEKIHLIGGAQAIAAMSLGTETVNKVDKIFGPGNQFVSLAKQFALSQGLVGIDLFAGPSEVCVFTNQANQVDNGLVECLAQVEHGPDSKALFIVSNGELKKLALEKLDKLDLSKAEKSQIEITICSSKEEIKTILYKKGPEHFINYSDLKLAEFANLVGAFYDGQNLSVAMGDFGLGPNHTLPTQGHCRFSSAVTVRDFQKSVSVVEKMNEINDKFKNSEQLIFDLSLIAESEGLKYHKLALLKSQCQTKVESRESL